MNSSGAGGLGTAGNLACSETIHSIQGVLDYPLNPSTQIVRRMVFPTLHLESLENHDP